MIVSKAAQRLRFPDLDAVTHQRLDLFVSQLHKWNGAINLVAKASLDDVWTRHITDSLQVLPFRDPSALTWLDLGSGAGLPGMVVAIALAEVAPDFRMTLVESDQRKAEFLRSVSRETGVDVTVLARRVEEVPPYHAKTVSARALAPLVRLCDFASRHLAPGGKAIFLKGAQADRELDVARTAWAFDLERQQSKTDPAGSVLVLSNIRHV